MSIVCFVGTDLGSTTTKSIILDGHGEILGRGITNSRSNYERAAKMARNEAFIDARFNLLEREVAATAGPVVLKRLLQAFRLQQMLAQLHRLHELVNGTLVFSLPAGLQPAAAAAVVTVVARIEQAELVRFEDLDPPTRSDFFRDTVGSAWRAIAEEIGDDSTHPAAQVDASDERAVEAIAQQLDSVRARLEAQGIEPGSPTALRLFS
jgi:benzoyl-CoA reductase subunit A